MTKEKLRKIFELMDSFTRIVDELDSLGINIVDTPLFGTTGIFFDMLIEDAYTPEGQDMINWFYFEKNMFPENKAYDENGNEICQDFDALYEYVKKFEK